MNDTAQPSGYILAKRFYDWCFKNQGFFKPTHHALYHWYLEAGNRSSWADSFEMPPQYGMTAIGIHRYNTYNDHLSDLIDWGFVRIVKKGYNQYTPWVIALSKFDEALHYPSSGALSKFDNPLRKAYNRVSKVALSKFDEVTDEAGSKASDEASGKAYDEATDEANDAITKNNKQENLNFKPKPQTANSAAGEGEQVLVEDQKKGQAPTPQSPPPSTAPKPIPIRAGKVYGDGKLQAEVLAFYRDNPDLFPLSVYIPFLQYYTSIFQKGKPDLIGTERWKTYDTWDLEAKLDNWYKRDLNAPVYENRTATIQSTSRKELTKPRVGTSFGKL